MCEFSKIIIFISIALSCMVAVNTKSSFGQTSGADNYTAVVMGGGVRAFNFEPSSSYQMRFYVPPGSLVRVIVDDVCESSRLLGYTHICMGYLAGLPRCGCAQFGNVNSMSDGNFKTSAIIPVDNIDEYILVPLASNSENMSINRNGKPQRYTRYSVNEGFFVINTRSDDGYSGCVKSFYRLNEGCSHAESLTMRKDSQTGFVIYTSDDLRLFSNINHDGVSSTLNPDCTGQLGESIATLWPSPVSSNVERIINTPVNFTEMNNRDVSQVIIECNSFELSQSNCDQKCYLWKGAFLSRQRYSLCAGMVMYYAQGGGKAPLSFPFEFDPCFNLRKYFRTNINDMYSDFNRFYDKFYDDCLGKSIGTSKIFSFASIFFPVDLRYMN